MASSYLYEMQHTFEEEGQIVIRFVFDRAMTEQVDQMEIGQDLSHFAHRFRRAFMLSVHYSYLRGGTHEEFEDRLSSCLYLQHIKQLSLKMTSVCCYTTSCLYNNMSYVSHKYCISLTGI